MDKQKSESPQPADLTITDMNRTGHVCTGSIDPVGYVQYLIEARDEDRLLILPCDVGNEIFQIMGRKIYRKVVVAIHVFRSSNLRAFEIQVQNDRGAITPISFKDIGVSVFLSRDEALDGLADRIGRLCWACDYWGQGDPRCFCELSQWFLSFVQPDNYCGQFVDRNTN